MKKLTSLIITLVLVLSLCSVPAFADNGELNLEGEAAILIDLTTGKVLYEKNADAMEYPASTTKMLTAILALENLGLENVLTMDDEVHATKGSVIGLQVGEEISVKNIVYAMMVRSANDGAVALAKGVSGSVENFSQLMNSKASALGCTGSHFVNPHGLHDEDHYTTARDLAIIARYCMCQSDYSDLFREMVALTEYTMPATNKRDVTTVVTTNYMLNDVQEKNRIYVGNELRYCKYEGCIGIKTGYTGEAGGCLVAAAERDGTTLLSVVLKSSSYGRFADSHKLLDWGFANYKTVTVKNAGEELGTIAVHKGEFNKVNAVLPDDIIATIPTEASSSIITTDVTLEEKLTAPVKAGQTVGTVIVYESGTQIDQYNAVAGTEVVEGGILSNFDIEDATAKKIFTILIVILCMLFAALIAWIMYMRHVTKVKKARRAAKIAAKKAEEERRRQLWEEHYNSRYDHYDDY